MYRFHRDFVLMYTVCAWITSSVIAMVCMRCTVASYAPCGFVQYRMLHGPLLSPTLFVSGGASKFHLGEL